jgi:phage portal protein BeeE
VGFFRRRRAEARTLTKETVPPVMLPSVPGETTVTPTNALSIADAYACIRALADAAASLPLIVYRRRGSGRERVEGGTTADLLRNPAPGVTQSSLVGTIVCHLNTHGNCWLGKFKDGDGKVTALGCLPPSSVTIEDLFRGPSQYCEFLVDAILRGDAESRWRVYETAIRLGAMTVEECRERENLAPLPPGRIQTPSPNGNGRVPIGVANG